MANDLITVNARIVGTQPLIMHNGELADPLSPYAVELGRLVLDAKARKKQKDSDVVMAIAQCEWNGGLWYDDVGGYPVIPTDAIEGTIRDGAKATKRGKQATAAVRCVEDARLLYDGPTDRAGLFDVLAPTGRKAHVDRRGVRVGQARVIRTRPRFNEWSLTFTIVIDTEALPVADAGQALVEAGKRRGIGDYRPKFGLFLVDSWERAKD